MTQDILLSALSVVEVYMTTEYCGQCGELVIVWHFGGICEVREHECKPVRQ